MSDYLEYFDVDEHDINEPLDPAITPKLFREWRSPRFGETNPEQMSNPVWGWLVRARVCAYIANEKYKGPSAFRAGPGWCFKRFGQTATRLPDGRIVLIAGEHEDHYDPDFYIYNDVTVLHPDRSITIYGYPKDVFPPTDFHTATLIGNRIIIIGSLGYPDERNPGTTSISVLDLGTFAIARIDASGSSPGWIHSHRAVLSKDGKSIMISGGLVEWDLDSSLKENIDDWLLHLDEWRWEQLTDRQWPQWIAVREDGECNHLWEIRTALSCQGIGFADEFQKSVESLTEAYSIKPNLELAATICRPNIPHVKLPDCEGEYNVVRIRVDGVIVRYVEESRAVKVIVEGELPTQTLDALKSDLVTKLSTLENTGYTVQSI